MAPHYLDFCFKIARGEKGMNRYDLMELAEQRGKQLQEFGREYELRTKSKGN